MMKRRFRLISLCLALVMMVSLLAACGSDSSESGSSAGDSGSSQSGGDGGGVTPLSGDNLPVNESGDPDPYGRYSEPITIRIGQLISATDTFPEGDSIEDNQYLRYVKEAMNIDVEIVWQAGSQSDFDQKINLAIASNDLPDAVRAKDTQYRSMVKFQQVADMSAVYEQFASDTFKQVVAMTDGKGMEAVTVDGQMLALPGIPVETDGYGLMYIRQDWLDTLGLPVPTTVDDLAATAQAFIDNNMGGNNTIGILGPQNGGNLYETFLQSTNGLYTFGPIFSAFRSYPAFWLKDGEGNAVYGSLTSETRAALEKLAEMYAAGLIDPEMGIRKDSGEVMKSGQAGIFFGPWWMGYGGVSDAVKNDPNASWMAYAGPLTDDGVWAPHLGSPVVEYTVVRKDYEHPEAAVLLANYFLRDEQTFDTTALSMGYYPVRTVLAAKNESTFSYDVLSKFLAGEEMPSYDSLLYKLLDNDLATVKDAKLEPYDDYRVEYWDTANANFSRMYSLLVGAGAIENALQNQQVEIVYSELYSQTATMEDKWTNLKKLEDETFLKIIMGEAPLEEFDSFVQTWLAQGGQEITDEVTEAIS